MVYSCAYFEHNAIDLEKAQSAKLDYVCRKLELTPGQSVLDLGCGWGALLVHAATHYGALVTGVTLSQAQAEHASGRIAEEGLNGQNRVVLADYRQVRKLGTFDVIASIGMAEHIQEHDLEEYFSVLRRSLRPGGLMLHHAISRSLHTPLRDGPSFMDRYIFPDSDIASISRTVAAAESSGFEVRDVENLREHYALTLHSWRERLEAQSQIARVLTDDVTYRSFQLYMAAAAHDFACGRLQIHQTLLFNPSKEFDATPRTRDRWYSPKARDVVLPAEAAQ